MDTVELDRLISKRAHQDTRPDPAEKEAHYMESVRRFNTRLRDANREAWAEYHMVQAQRHKAVLEDLISRHQTMAEILQSNDERK